MYRLRKTLFPMLLLWVFAPFSALAQQPVKILTVGDSLLAAHKVSKNAISNHVAKGTNAQITDRSVLGARMIYKLPITGSMGLSIPMQFRKGDWDWVIMNGGGNDLWLGCGCGSCDRKMNKLISANGKSGEIPKLAKTALKTGAKVIVVGYLRSPGMGSPIESCKDEGDELDRRVAKMAAMYKNIYFLSNADLVPHGDRSYFGLDMIHPSIKASRAIGERVSKIINR